jgi:hypothetical protein
LEISACHLPTARFLGGRDDVDSEWLHAQMATTNTIAKATRPIALIQNDRGWRRIEWLMAA